VEEKGGEDVKMKSGLCILSDEKWCASSSVRRAAKTITTNDSDWSKRKKIPWERVLAALGGLKHCISPPKMIFDRKPVPKAEVEFYG